MLAILLIIVTQSLMAEVSHAKGDLNICCAQFDKTNLPKMYMCFHSSYVCTLVTEQLVCVAHTHMFTIYMV